MKKVLLGFIIGIVAAVSAYLFLNPNPMPRINLGRLLDKDTIYLANGQILDGWIADENENTILLEVEKGTVTLSRARCRSIQKNKLLQYIRDLM